MLKHVLFAALSLAVGVAHASEEAAAADPAKAKPLVDQMCGACHGPDGNSPVPVNPKLAGQFPEYIYKQLSNFKSKDGKPAERANPIMGGMAAGLSDQDMKNLAAYFGGQTLKPEQAKGDKESIDLGQKLWRGGDASRHLPACAGCHGPAGAGIPAQFPRLAGQYADYTEAQLKAFRNGDRANDPAQMMRVIASKMSDKEIKAVADYVAGLR
ncbi:MAG: cytochrome c4 [Rhodocyclaceae bacterium]|nr:cytochrome c4 [Rhodocyclaceae bacterium]MBX3671044.1 cytochrome c4 [Rhodocyclaceae bacterium]